MKKILILTIAIFILFTIGVVAVECGSIPTDGCEVTIDTTFNTGNYYLPNGISINADNVVLDCNGSTLIGDHSINLSGVQIGSSVSNPRLNVTVKNCNIRSYNFGITLWLAYNSAVINNNVSDSDSSGIMIFAQSSKNTILNNHATFNRRGIFSCGGGNNVISNNIACNNYPLIGDINSCDNTPDDIGQNNFCDWANDWNDTGKVGCTYTCAQATGDSDLDGVIDILDKCPNSPKEEVDQDGCSNVQFCAMQGICGLSCNLADWKHDEPFSNNPYDCMTVIVAKEGGYQPTCAGSTCAD